MSGSPYASNTSWRTSSSESCRSNRPAMVIQRTGGISAWGQTVLAPLSLLHAESGPLNFRLVFCLFSPSPRCYVRVRSPQGSFGVDRT